MVVQRLVTVQTRQTFQGRPNTRPRKVVADVVIPEHLDQDVLVALSKKYTRPYRGRAYRDPEHVKVYCAVARRSGMPEDWKRALAEREKARRQWREEQIRAANNGDWGAYREVAKRGATGWEAHFANHMAEQGSEPHDAVHQHFEAIYKGEPIPPFPFETVPRSPDFTSEELHEAIHKRKGGKSNGGDGVPHELLKAIQANPEGERLMLAWFNRMLHGEEPLPVSWSRAVMVLLPKCPKPEAPKHLRPICLGSSANKVYARMLLSRAKPALQYSNAFQNMGAGRQTVDYVWTIARLMQLDQEWKEGLWFLKLDIEKAFDSLHGGRFLSRLALKMGNCEELRSWWDMFQHTGH